MANGGMVVAAGAVVTRRGSSGKREVLLVHRPKYDDWSFPKGKQDPGEHVTATAVREVVEESGVEIRLGRPLLPQLYSVSGGRSKQVHYWVGRALGGEDVSSYVVNDEVDEVAWVPLKEAVRRLSYLDDVSLLEQFRDTPKRTSALIVLRHARARKRAHWTGEDHQRPITRVGQEQAELLVPVLHAYGVSRVVTSPSTRCAQTVAPYAQQHVLPVEEWKDLSEEDENDQVIDDLLERVLAEKESTVICSHRPVLPHIIERLGVTEEPLEPGEMLVCHHRKGRIVSVERHLVR